MITPGFGGMGLLDSFMFGGGFEILFFLIFALVLCLFIVMIVRGVSQWHRNNNSPRLTVEPLWWPSGSMSPTITTEARPIT